METETADHFREKAEQCRLAAGMILNQEEPVVAHLLTLAVAFEAKAAALECPNGAATQATR